MDNWLWFWKVLLLDAFQLFAGLAVVVTFAGIFDIIAMFRNVAKQHEEKAASGENSQESSS